MSGGSSFREDPVETMLSGTGGGLSAGATIGGVADLRRARAEEEAEEGTRVDAPSLERIKNSYGYHILYQKTNLSKIKIKGDEEVKKPTKGASPKGSPLALLEGVVRLNHSMEKRSLPERHERIERAERKRSEEPAGVGGALGIKSYVMPKLLEFCPMTGLQERDGGKGRRFGVGEVVGKLKKGLQKKF